MHLALQNRHELTAALLLAHGASASLVDASGQTALHICAEHDLPSSAIVLTEAGANLEARSSRHHATPLATAALCHSSIVAITLLNLGADPNTTCDGGISPLDFAAKHNDAHLISALLAHGADIETRSVSGWTPLHAAAAFNSCQAIAALLQYGARVDTSDCDGDTPLLTAASLGHTHAVHMLLAAGADVCITTKVGKYLNVEPIRNLLLQYSLKPRQRSTWQQWLGLWT